MLYRPEKLYIFIIDTNKYAGNFEREMTAYCTGFVGECYVGTSEAEEFGEDFDCDPLEKFQNYVISQPDDRGCCRPCSIWPSLDGKAYNSVAIFFEEQPTKEQVEIIKERSRTYAERIDVEIEGLRLELETIVTKEISFDELA